MIFQDPLSSLHPFYRRRLASGFAIRVLRRERVSVPAGEFNAIVVQPVIKSKGIFSENGHAEVWLSDDRNRIMLQMKSGLSFGSINLYLKSYRPAQAGSTVKTP